MYDVVQVFKSIITDMTETIVVHTSKSLWRARLYRWWHYTIGADPAWKMSFSWHIEKRDE
jgi:hypothetical protein